MSTGALERGSDGLGWNQQLVIIWIYNPHTKDATNEGAERLVWWGFFSLWIPWAWNGEGWPLFSFLWDQSSNSLRKVIFGWWFPCVLILSLGKNRTRSKQTQLKIRLAVGHTAPILHPQDKVTFFVVELILRIWNEQSSNTPCLVVLKILDYTKTQLHGDDVVCYDMDS